MSYFSVYSMILSILICCQASIDLMANIIEEFYYGNIEPQELNSELAHELKIKLSKLADKEEKLTALLNGEEKELLCAYWCCL